MTVIGLCQQFPAGILNGYEGLGLRTGVSAHPADSFIGGIIDTFVRDCDYEGLRFNLN